MGELRAVRSAVEAEDEVQPDAALTAELRLAFLVRPTEVLVERHLALMLGAVPAVAAPVSRRGRWAVGALAVALVGGGSLAGAGALPAPVQSAVAAVLRPVGIDLPDPDAPAGGTAPGDQNPGAWSSAPGQQDQPGQSEDAPGHGGVAPGRSEEAPGRGGDGPPGAPADLGVPPDKGNAPELTPASGGEPPGVTAPPVDPPKGPPESNPAPTASVKAPPAPAGGTDASGGTTDGGDTGDGASDGKAK